jgi:hypothetical protein
MRCIRWGLVRIAEHHESGMMFSFRVDELPA